MFWERGDVVRWLVATTLRLELQLWKGREAKLQRRMEQKLSELEKWLLFWLECGTDCEQIAIRSPSGLSVLMKGEHLSIIVGQLQSKFAVDSFEDRMPEIFCLCTWTLMTKFL